MKKGKSKNYVATYNHPLLGSGWKIIIPAFSLTGARIKAERWQVAYGKLQSLKLHN